MKSLSVRIISGSLPATARSTQSPNFCSLFVPGLPDSFSFISLYNWHSLAPRSSSKDMMAEDLSLTASPRGKRILSSGFPSSSSRAFEKQHLHHLFLVERGCLGKGSDAPACQGWLKCGNSGTAFRAEQGPCEPSKGLVRERHTGRPQGRYYRPLVDNRPFCLNGRYS